MWFTNKTLKRYLFVLLVFLGILGCSELESNIQLFYGEWLVNEVRWTLVNGKPGPSVLQNYYMELNSDNCGVMYNLDKEKTGTYKWIYSQEDEGDTLSQGNHFLLSTQLGTNESLSVLAKDNLYFVNKLHEDEIRLSRSKIRISNDTTFNTIWNLILTKE